MIDLHRVEKNKRGDKVKIAGVNLDAEPGYEILGWYYNSHSCVWYNCNWHIDGTFFKGNNPELDLIEKHVLKPFQVYRNIHTRNHYMVVNYPDDRAVRLIGQTLSYILPEEFEIENYELVYDPNE